MTLVNRVFGARGLHNILWPNYGGFNLLLALWASNNYLAYPLDQLMIS